MLSEAAEHRLREVFAGHPAVRAAYVFGSVAADRERDRSDLDLGIVADPDRWEPTDHKVPLITACMEAAGRDRIDLVVLDDASLVVQFEAVRPSVLLYARDDFHHGRFFQRLRACTGISSPTSGGSARPSKNDCERQPMVDANVLRRRLQKLSEYLDILRETQQYSRSEFIEDPHLHGSAERFLRLSIEAINDVASRVIVDENLGAMERARDLPDLRGTPSRRRGFPLRRKTGRVLRLTRRSSS